VYAVKDVWATFEHGTVTVVLIGPNGAGKTTLFHLMSGFLVPDSGEVLLDGNRINGLAAWKIARMGVGRLFQDIRVFRRLTALENILVAFQNQAGETFWKAVIARPAILAQEDKFKEEAKRLLAFVGLKGMETTPAGALSYGQQKLLALARLLAQGAKVLLLDEPTAGVDPAMVRPLLQLLQNLARQGKTIIVIEHNISVVLEIAKWEIAKRVYFMDDGQIVARGLPQDVLGSRRVREAYLGL
jgi:ABC-type branched-subunit amino acid transport system ATPase component